MLKKILIIGWLSAISGGIWAQDPSFSISITADTMGQGDYIKVIYTLENIDNHNWLIPSFDGFEILSSSSSHSIIYNNGVKSDSREYAYYIRALETGKFELPPVKVMSNDGPLISESKWIQVLSQEVLPERFQQKNLERRNSFFDQFNKDFPPPPKPPKRKTYRS